MRYGFTSGSCAAAAAKAACYMLLTGNEKKEICISTPKGIDFKAKLLDIEITEGYARCCVVKDGGDDPDITSGAKIFAKVILGKASDELKISIDGGKGVGRVSLPGLNQPIGEAAINSVPRQMIENEVRNICEFLDYKGELKVIIEVPDGEKLAKSTFNSRLGIEGGISILGTSGIVEPMSNQAILDTIKVELSQRKALGDSKIVISPGNYGQEYMKRSYGYDLNKSVKCSNFIGDTIDIVKELGFKDMLLVGHIGKLVKLSGGIMNTHSKIADLRMELLAKAAKANGAKEEQLKEVKNCISTEEAARVLEKYGLLQKSMIFVMENAMLYLKERAGKDLHIECMMYSNDLGALAESEGATSLLNEIMKAKEGMEID